ncbi:MAG: hypothetical protein JWM11_5097 [Planctomycetaceae bacterium]|nr:hypothetical protein [Planctomycetaceae bacterium]
MNITLDPDLESALSDLARKRGLTPEVLVLNTLREQILAPTRHIQPQDEWERRLVGIATDCGVSLPHETVSSDGLYD